MHTVMVWGYYERSGAAYQLTGRACMGVRERLVLLTGQLTGRSLTGTCVLQVDMVFHLFGWLRLIPVY